MAVLAIFRYDVKPGRTADFIEKPISEQELPASIDFRELERTARDIADATARKLVNFAMADVLVARGQAARALEQLRPHLSDSRPVRE